MPSLASLARQSRKLQGVALKEARKRVQRAAVQAVADGCAQDERIIALREHLEASPAAARWALWAGERFTSERAERCASVVACQDVEEAIGQAYIRRASMAHAKYLLGVAYGTAEAIRLCALDWQEPEETTDDPIDAKYRADRRAAMKAAGAATTAHTKDSEPRCPESLRRPVAMLLLLTDANLLHALPTGVKAGLMLPDALRAANTLLPQTAQVDAETVETLVTTRR